MSSPPQPLPRKQRPRQWSFLRLIGGCCVATFAVVGLVVAYFIGSFVLSTLKQVRDPHSARLHDHAFHANLSKHHGGPLPVGLDPARPLIQHDTPFDLVLTIWRKKPYDAAKVEELQRGIDSGTMDLGINEHAAQLFASMNLIDVLYPVEEEVLLQQVVWEGINLETAKTPKEVDVEFDLPVDRFYDSKIITFDVRATLTLIPWSPSPLDRLVHFWDYRPSPQASPMDRLDPSPDALASLPHLPRFLRSGSDSPDTPPDITEGRANVTWNALKHTAISWGLVNQWEIPSICGGLRVPVKHPFVVTRSHVYMINETREFNRAQYLMAHEDLAASSCGQTYLGSPKSRWLCDRSYEKDGHWETPLWLTPPGHSADSDGEDPDIAENRQLAYGPYMGVLPNSAGPKHQVKVPVTREVCDPVNEDDLDVNGDSDLRDADRLPYPAPDHEGSVPSPASIPVADRSKDPKSIKIRYTLAFSTISPARLKWVENFAPQVDAPVGVLDPNATAAEIDREHDMWEFLTAFHGLQKEGHGRKPWVVFVAGASEAIITFSCLVLQILYFHTRYTTAGLSTTSVYAAFSSRVLELGHTAYLTMQDEEPDLWLASGFGVLQFVELWPWVVGLVKVLPIEVTLGRARGRGRTSDRSQGGSDEKDGGEDKRRGGWWRFWELRVGISRRRWTRRERQSRRTDEGISWALRAGIFGTFYVFVFLTMHFDIFLFPPSHPPPAPVSVPTSPTDRTLRRALWHAVPYTLMLSAQVYQLLLNHRRARLLSPSAGDPTPTTSQSTLRPSVFGSSTSRMQAFAGQYALTARLAFLALLLGLAETGAGPVGRAVFGRQEVWSGLHWAKGAEIGLAGWAAWQSVRWSRVEQVVEEEENE